MSAPPRRIRHDWSTDEVLALYGSPLLDLLFQAQVVHREHHDPRAVQRCSLLSIKTGGCPEDCGYCPQASRYDTGVAREPLMAVDDVLARAQEARDRGATRFCMGAAWRSPKEGEGFEQVLAMVRGVRALGMEACVTLGMLTADQAEALADAGLSAYNHNLDTSEAHYPKVIGTRSYADRLETLARVQASGVSVCAGGILGLGEGPEDRCAMLATLARLDPHPESVPINVLVRSPGTPLADAEPVDPLDVARMVATARIVLPRARVRLSAGRQELGRLGQALCFLAGANSIFFGDRLLTTPNPTADADEALLRALGLAAEASGPVA